MPSAQEAQYPVGARQRLEELQQKLVQSSVLFQLGVWRGLESLPPKPSHPLLRAEETPWPSVTVVLWVHL